MGTESRPFPNPSAMLPKLDAIIENFEILDDPYDRYEYVIELGKLMPKMPEERKTEDIPRSRTRNPRRS